jgi:predicted outer membrane repeat protein
MLAVLVLPGALQARLSKKPAEIVVHNCKVASLVEAVDQANATAGPDTIVLKGKCTYTLTSGPYVDAEWGSASGLPVVSEPLTIEGNGATIARDPTAPPFRLLTVAASGFTLRGVTLRGGSSVGQPGGGAIFMTNVDAATIESTTFAGNSAELRGGAMFAGATTLALVGNRFEDNHVTLGGPGEVRGGGALAVSGLELVIRDSSFLANDTATDYGGAIAFGGGSATVERSTFTSNSELGSGVGGAIWIMGAPGGFRVTDSTFTANSAGSGAALSLEGGLNTSNLIDVTGSTFDGNTGHSVIGAINGPEGDIVVANSTFSASDVWGAVISSWGGAIDIRNSTVAGTVGGAAVNLSSYQGVVTTGTVRNSILEGSGGALCSGWPVTDGGGNVVFGGGGCPGTMTWGDANLDPLADNGGLTWTMALGVGSPAIDTANDATCPLVDQRGVTRPQGPHCDVGAYELVP